MTRIISLLALILVIQPAFAQQQKLDSLKQELARHPKEDTMRLNILNAIANANSAVSPETGLAVADEAIALAKKLQEPKKMALAYKFKSNNYAALEQDSLALECYQQALNIYEKISFKEGAAKTCFNMGIMHSNLGNYTTALAYEQRAAKLFDEIGDLENMSTALNSVGVNYNYLADYPKALECYLGSMRNFERLGKTESTSMAN